MPLNYHAIYLGNFATELDPTEGNVVAENAAVLNTQTFGSAGDPLFDHVVSVSSSNFYPPNDYLNQDNLRDPPLPGAHDDFDADLNGDGIIGAGEGQPFDAVVTYNVTLNYADGTSASVVVPIIQTTTGDLYLVPAHSTFANADAINAAITAKPLESIEVLTVHQDAYTGYQRDQQELAFPCFAAGTRIATPNGEVAVEDLAAGDLVLTLDDGAQPLRWIGSAEVDLADAPNMRPVRIRAGALGAGMPATDLVVSPQHRVLVRSKIAQRMFGTDEVLVAAKQLLVLDGIELAQDMDRVTYYHFLFDRHQVVISNGAQTESLFTGPEALKSVGPAARDEILSLFPDLADMQAAPARMLVPGRKARRLADRHADHGRLLAS